MSAAITIVGLSAFVALGAPPKDRPHHKKGEKPRVSRIGRTPVEAHPMPIEFGENLARFVNAARRAQTGLQRQLRVLHFGDSNIAARSWSDATASRLAGASRPGGLGYALPKPGRSVRSDSALVTSGSGWKWLQARFVKGRADVGDGRFGLFGAALDGVGPDAFLDVRLPANERRTVDVFALCRPRGGTLVFTTGTGTHHRTTECDDVSVIRETVTLDGARPRLRIQGRGRPVRVLGVSVERDTGGVVYDVLGISGHQISAMMRWSASTFGTQLRTRRPDLVVLSYGGNEAFNRHLSLSAYRAMLEYAVDRVRMMAPDAACLLTGPIATCPRGRVAAATPRVEAIIGIQRVVARQAGCGFWDSAAVTGGADALCPWITARPPLVAPDGMHLSRRGYTLLGEALGDALLNLITGATASRAGTGPDESTEHAAGRPAPRPEMP